MSGVAGPEHIGRYRVTRFLGSGGFASVWLGTDDTLDQPVAIKVLAENWANVKDVHQRFLREATLLRTADSDRVVRMYDIGQLDDGRPYFVMSYADRGTLTDRLQEPIPTPHALHLATETARAVAILHHHGIVHRDIKPSNVLLQTTPHGTERILIGDLGVAKHIAQATGHTIAAGTPGYMAPEQTHPSADIDPRADVYGLGALTYHLLNGSKYAGNLDGLPQLPRVKEVLARALEPDRAHRWPHAGAFAEALAGATTNTVPSTATSPAAHPTGSRPGFPPAGYDDDSTPPVAAWDGRSPRFGTPPPSHPTGPTTGPTGQPAGRAKNLWQRQSKAGRIVVGAAVVAAVAIGVAASLGAFTPEADGQQPVAQAPKSWPATITNTWSESKQQYLGTYSYRSPFERGQAGRGYGEGKTVRIECQERDGRSIDDPSTGESTTVWNRTTDGVYISDLYTDLGNTPPEDIPACTYS
jgi:eukaryotic-like serine/threonine-protein kinase